MNYTFSEMLEKWLKTKDGIKKQSMLNYENMIKSHLEETLGRKKLNKLKKDEKKEYGRTLINSLEIFQEKIQFICEIEVRKHPNNKIQIYNFSDCAYIE